MTIASGIVTSLIAAIAALSGVALDRFMTLYTERQEQIDHYHLESANSLFDIDRANDVQNLRAKAGDRHRRFAIYASPEEIIMLSKLNEAECGYMGSDIDSDECRDLHVQWIQRVRKEIGMRPVDANYIVYAIRPWGKD